MQDIDKVQENLDAANTKLDEIGTQTATLVTEVLSLREQVGNVLSQEKFDKLAASAEALKTKVFGVDAAQDAASAEAPEAPVDAPVSEEEPTS